MQTSQNLNFKLYACDEFSPDDNFIIIDIFLTPCAYLHATVKTVRKAWDKLCLGKRQVA